MATATATTKKGLELLSEKGKKVMELKQVLFSNQGNSLIFDGLASSISKNDYQEHVYQNLLSCTCTPSDFESILISVSEYTNEKILKKQFEGFRSKLSSSLERKGQNHFSTDVCLKRGGVVVVKKIGINKDFIRKEFSLSAQEALKLKRSGFIEQYGKLKINAVIQKMMKAVGEIRKQNSVQFELSDFYYDDSTGFYNVDIISVIKVSESDINGSTPVILRYATYMDRVLSEIDKIYHKSFNG